MENDGDGEFVDFGVIRERTGMPIQYAIRYADGAFGCENLGEGLRFRKLDPGNFSGEIHRDDVDEFVRRLKKLKGLK